MIVCVFISSHSASSSGPASTSARIQITPLGSGSRWQIDDVYIDPCIGRIA
jgi:hypothetical protein